MKKKSEGVMKKIIYAFFGIGSFIGGAYLFYYVYRKKKDKSVTKGDVDDEKIENKEYQIPEDNFALASTEYGVDKIDLMEFHLVNEIFEEITNITIESLIKSSRYLEEYKNTIPDNELHAIKKQCIKKFKIL
jgi:hypothetical protein